MAWGDTNISCGVSQLWCPCAPIEDEVKAMCYKMYNEGLRKAAVVFSGAVDAVTKKAGVGWIGQLVRFVENHKLGEIVQSTPIKNNRYTYNPDGSGTGTLIAVWIWTIDQPALKAWYAERCKADEQKAKDLQGKLGSASASSLGNPPRWVGWGLK